jgi:hypothetical protein
MIFKPKLLLKSSSYEIINHILLFAMIQASAFAQIDLKGFLDVNYVQEGQTRQNVFVIFGWCFRLAFLILAFSILSTVKKSIKP